MSVRQTFVSAILPAWLAVLILAAASDRVFGDQQPQPESQRSLSQLLAADHGVREIVFAMRPRGKDPHWYANFGYYAENDKRLPYGNGGKLCRLDLATGKVTTLLDDKEGTVRDPVVHYDAEKILFSYRKGGTSFHHLYEIGIDGGNLRQLTDGPFDDIEPCYLPDGTIVFISSRCKRWVGCWLTQVANMHRCEGDGRNIREISANIEQDNTPWPLPDGRVLYQRWEYVDRSQVHFHHLWTANPDGTAEMVYFGNLNPGTVMIDAKPIPQTHKVVAIFSPGHGRTDHNGVITVVDPGKGPDEQSFARPIASSTDYRDPWAFSEQLFMAARHKEIVLLDDGSRTEEIYRVTDEEAAAGLECHEPRPIMKRQRERIVPDRTDPQQETGTLVLMDVYQGRNMTGVERGEIKKLLVLETLAKPINYSGGMEPVTYGGSFTLERVLGTVPVEADGSASFELPALRPVFFVALDENDMAVKRMQSFTNVQPGEVSGCIGCHERRTETMLPHGNAMALSRKPSQIERIADCPEVFDFPRDVQPILDRLCADCHGYEKTARGGPYAGKVILSGDRGPMYSHSYITMTLRGLFSDGRNQPKGNYPPRTLGSSASRILKMLDGSHYGVQADAHERKMLRLWIEVGAPYPGTYAALGCGSIGDYAENKQVNADWDWPTTRDGGEVIARRCASCHKDAKKLPRSLSDGYDGSSMSRHIVFNLTRPEKSLLLLAPLVEAAGGFALCRDAEGKPAAVFADTNDPDYEKLLAMATAGQQKLAAIKRFDMPGFRPCEPYLREMRRYGILPANYAEDAPLDGYALDRRYWESLWYRAPAASDPSCPVGRPGPGAPMFPGQGFPGRAAP